jgi:hypothetical protein
MPHVLPWRSALLDLFYCTQTESEFSQLFTTQSFSYYRLQVLLYWCASQAALHSLWIWLPEAAWHWFCLNAGLILSPLVSQAPSWLTKSLPGRHGPEEEVKLLNVSLFAVTSIT